MNEVNLKVKKRDTGKQIAKRIRKSGYVPGVFYISGEKSIPVVAEPLSLRPIVFTDETKIVNLEVEGIPEVKECVLKDVTFDPVTDKITHFDLFGFVQGKLFTVEVPIMLKGQSTGVREGGVLQHTLRKTTISCLPKNLPNAIEVDITNLAIGKALYIKDIHTPDIQFNMPPETVVVSVIPSRVSAKGE